VVMPLIMMGDGFWFWQLKLELVRNGFSILGKCDGLWLRSPVEKDTRLVDKKEWFLISMREVLC